MTTTSTGPASDLFAAMGSPVAESTATLEKKGAEAMEKVLDAEVQTGVSQQLQEAITFAEQQVADAAEREADYEAFKSRVTQEFASVNLDDAQAKRQQLQEDFRDVTFALLGEMRNLDVSVSQLQGECPEADAEVAKSEERLKKADHAVGAAQASFDLVSAQSPGFFEFITKAHRNSVRDAKKRLSRAQTELREAEADIEPAKARAEEIRRQKIMEADISGLLQLYQTRSSSVVSHADECLRVLEAEEASVVADRKQVLADKVEAEKTLTEINAKLEAKESEVRSLRDEIAGTTDTAERSKLEESLANAEHELKTLENNRNKAYMYAQSKTRGAEILKQTEDGIRSIHGSIDAYRLMLKSDTEHRVTAYQATVEVGKGLEHMKTIQMTDQVGAETDKRVLEVTAAASIAAKRAVATAMQDHEGRMDNLLVIKQQFAMNDAEVSDEIVAELAAFFEQHGVDGRDYATLSYRQVGGVKDAAHAASGN